MKQTKKTKIIVIVGQTSSGKSDLAVRLAKKFSAKGGLGSGWNGAEIISADSRQVYKGLNIGTGKITKKEMRGIPHHLLSITNPRNIYTAGKFKTDAEKVIRSIAQKRKVPIIAGGTGFYIDALVGTVSLPEVEPDPQLRKKLEKKTTEALFKKLKKLDSVRARSIDQYNRPRLIRAIEIVTAIGKVPLQKYSSILEYDVLKIGIVVPDEKLKKKIKKRLAVRIKQGMVAEVRRLHNPPTGGGLSWKRMESLGLEYRYLSRYIRGAITKDEMFEQLNREIWHYAKRQKRWFKRDKNIRWFTSSEVRGFKISEIKKIEKEIKKFLKS